MIYCNPVPIAAGCLLEKGVVADALQAIFNAIIDLTKHGRDITLQFGFATFSIVDKALKVTFKRDFAQSIQDKTFQNKVSGELLNSKMKKALASTSSHWKTSYNKTFA